MANLVALENATVVYGTTAVLDAVSTGVGTGQRIGVVGRNGGGKSTLLRVLAGDQAADGGRVTRAGGTTVGLLSQDDTLDPELCELLLSGMEPIEELMRESGQYGPRVPVPGDADPQSRLIGFIGRDPEWMAATSS